MEKKYSSVDSYYGPYDTEAEALEKMKQVALDGRLVSVYSDKINGEVKLYRYNAVQEKLIVAGVDESISMEEFVNVPVTSSEIVISNETTPFARIKLNTNDNIYVLNIVDVADGRKGKILVEQTGYKKIATDSNIIGEFQLTSNPGTLVLCTYNVIGSNIYITTDVVLGDNQVTLVKPVTELIYVYYDNSSVGLQWVAPSAQTIIDPVSYYDIRYSNSSIDANSPDWNSLKKISNNIVPKNPGQIETITIIDLKPGTEYYFYIKAVKITLGVTAFSTSSEELYIKTSGSANIAEKAYNIPVNAESLYPQQYAYLTDSATDELCSIDKIVDEKENNKFLTDGYPDLTNKNFNTYWRTYSYSRDTAPFYVDIDLYQSYRLDRIYLLGRTKQICNIYAKKNLTDKFEKVGSISSSFGDWSMINFDKKEYRVIRIAYEVFDFGSMSTNPVMAPGQEGFPDPQYGNTEPINNMLIFGLPMSKPDGIHEPLRRTTTKKTVDEFFSVNGHAYQQGRIHALSGGSKMRMYIHFGHFGHFSESGSLLTPTSLADLRFRVNDIPWVKSNNGLNEGLVYTLQNTYAKYGLKPYFTNTGVMDICAYEKAKYHRARPVDDYWYPGAWKPVPKRGYDGLDKYYEKTKDPNQYKTYTKLGFALGAKYGKPLGIPGENLFNPATESPVTGLDLISGIEMENEPDGNWNGWVGYANSEEFAALQSSTSDGHQNTLRDENNYPLFGIKPTGLMSVGSGTAGINKGYYFSAINYWKSIRTDGSIPVDSFSLHRYFSNVGNQGTNTQSAIRYGITLEESIRNPVGGSILDIVKIRDRITPKTELWLTEFGWGESGAPDTKSSYQCYTQPGRIVNGWTIRDRHRSEVKGAWTVRATLQLMNKGFDMVNYYSTECENNYFDNGRWGAGPGFEMFHWNDITSNQPGLKAEYIKNYEHQFERGGFASMGLFGQILGNGAYPITNAYWWTSTMRNTLRGYTFYGTKKHPANPRITILAFKKTDEEKGAYVIYYDDMINTGVTNIDITVPSESPNVKNISVYLPELTNPLNVPRNIGNDQARTGLPTSRKERFTNGSWVITNLPYDGVNRSSLTTAPAVYPSNPQEGAEVVTLPTMQENPYFPIVGPVWARPSSNDIALTAQQYEQQFDSGGGVMKWEAKNNNILSWRQVDAVLDYIEFHPEGIKGSHGVEKTIEKIGDHITINISEFPEFYLFDGIPEIDFDSKISNLATTPINGNTIDLWWNNTNVEDTGYDIFISSLPETGYTLYTTVLTGSENKLSIQGLNADSTYYFKVRPRKDTSVGTMSDYVSVKTFSELPAPSNLSLVRRTTNTVDIVWDYTDTQLPDFVHYAIYRSSDTSSFTLIGQVDNKATKTFLDRNLSIGKNYTYRVRAIGLNGFSPYSNEMATRTLLPEEMPPVLLKAVTDKLGSKVALTFDMNVELVNADKTLVIKTSEPAVSVFDPPIIKILEYKSVTIDPYNANVLNVNMEEDQIPLFNITWITVFLDYEGSNIRSINGGLLLGTIIDYQIKNRNGDFSGINNVWKLNFTDPAYLVDHSLFDNWNNILYTQGQVEYPSLENTKAETTDLKLIKVDNGANIRWGNLQGNGESSLPTSSIPIKAITRFFSFTYGAKADEKTKARMQLVNLDQTKIYTIQVYGGTKDNEPLLKRPARMKINGVYSKTIEQSTNRNEYMTIENVRVINGVIDVDFITMYPEDSPSNTTYPGVNWMIITELDNPDDAVNAEVFLKDTEITPVNPKNDIVGEDVEVSINILGVANKYRISEIADMTGVEWIPIAEDEILKFPYKLTNNLLDETTIYIQAGNNNNDTKIRASKHKIRLSPGIQSLSLNLETNKNITSKRKIKCSIDYTGLAKEYAINETNDFTNAEWLPIKNLFEYTLTQELGTKIVYAKVRFVDNTESDTVSNSISLLTSNNERILFTFGTSGTYPITKVNQVIKTEIGASFENNPTGKYCNAIAITQDSNGYPVIDPDYGSHYLFNSLGETTNLLVHLNSKFYPIVQGTFVKEGTGFHMEAMYLNNGNDRPLSKFPEPHNVWLDLDGITPDLANVKGRLVFTFPAGSYSVKFISSSDYPETGMPAAAATTSFFAAYDINKNYTVLDRVNVGPPGFTGALNIDYNAVLNFTITEATEIAISAYNHSFNKVPRINIMEIVCKPTSDPVLILKSIKINDSAEITYSNSVQVTSDFDGEPLKYKIAESEEALSNASWVTFQNIIQYNLIDSEGTKTLYMQLQSNDLVSEVKSASILYIKNNKHIINLDVTVPSGTDPNNITLEFPKIKFNKKFMFSYITDDACSIYQFIFSGINKRYVATRENRFLHLNFPILPEFADGFTPDEVLQFTDGTGKNRRFATSVAMWPDKLVDVNGTIGADVGMYWPWMSEKEFKLFKDFGFSVLYHDLNDYESATATQELFNGWFETTKNKFIEYLGMAPKGMAEPNGDHKYLTFCRNIADVKFLTAQGGVTIKKVYPYTSSYTLNKQDVAIERYFAGPTDYANNVFNILSGFNTTTDLNSIYWLLGSAHKSGLWEYELFKRLSDSFGAKGSDKLLFATIDEIYEYWFLTKNATVSKTVVGQKVSFQIEMPKLSDFWFNEISCLLNGIISTTDVVVEANAEGLSYGISDNKLLVNIDFNGNLLLKAEKYTAAFEAQPGNVVAYEDALYMINFLKTSLQTPFIDRINAVLKPVVLSSLVINGGSPTHTSKTVSVALTIGDGTPTHYRIAETPEDLSYAPWIAWSTTITYTFNSFGTKTLHGQVKNMVNESEVKSSTITLNEALPKVLVGLNNQTVNSILNITSNGLVTNQILVAIGTGYTARNLLDTNGEATQISVNFKSSFYAANNFFALNQYNNPFNANIAAQHATVASGLYDLAVMKTTYTAGNFAPEENKRKTRISFNFPVGSYRFKILMNTTTNYGITNESMRTNSFYGIFQGDVEIARKVVSDNPAFTGVGNQDFNQTFDFEVTNGSIPIDFGSWSTTGNNRPCFNLVEITKLS